MDVNDKCPRCAAPKARWNRVGFYHRLDDSKKIQRWKCKDCAKKFSSATFKPTYNQKKRRINQTIRFGFASNMCQRDIAERRTWCTTKKPERLADHIDIFIDVFCDRLKLLDVSVNRYRNGGNGGNGSEAIA